MLRLSRVSSLFALGLVGVVATGSIAVSAPAVAPQVPDPYFPADGNVGYDVQHYDIHDTYQLAEKRLRGVTTITLTPLVELATFNLDLLLTVDWVRIDGQAVEFDKTNSHELQVTPAEPLTAGEQVQVRVRYHGFPDRLSWGGEASWLANSREVVTMNEPHMAAWWFPSNDHPTDKATFDIKITTAKAREVISNGVLVDRRVHGTQATTHWRMADPMTTYLAFFAAGDFTIEKGRSHGQRYYNAVSQQLSAAAQRTSMARMRTSARITAWLEDELGDYPFATTGGVVTSLDPGFALENQSRPTYWDSPPLTIVVHELAHQWFGDSVSVARWRDIWLNEGFATYMQWRYDEAHGGMTTNRWLRQSWEWYDAFDSFWDLELTDPGPHRIFDSAVYDRGAMTLAALRNRIGNAEFRQLLRQWAADNADGNAEFAEFEDLAEQVSDAELDTFFDVWLRTPERPARTTANGF